MVASSPVRKDTQQQQDDEPNDNTNKIERIYIGGIDPSKGLKPFHLIKRLKQIRDVNILSIDDGTATNTEDDRTYLFLNATVNKDKASALDVIANQYNNVMWKGCKLRVERAKLHFLERLKLERMERLQREELKEQPEGKLKENENTASSKDDVDDINENTCQKNVPRHLRIKRKHGEEAFLIDTKPRHVQDFSHFDKMLQLMKQRRVKYDAKLLEDKKKRKKKKQQKGKEEVMTAKEDQKEEMKKMKKAKAYLNRAVHVRFGVDDHDDKGGGIVNDARKKDLEQDKIAHHRKGMDENEDRSSDESDVTTSESESDMSEEEEKNERKPSAYAWSDDDEDDDGEGEETKNDTNKENGDIKNDPILSSEEDDDDVNSKDSTNIIENEDEEESGGDNKRKNNESTATNKMKKKAYVWSDDDDDDDSTGSETSITDYHLGQTSKYTSKNINAMDEFSGGLDFDVDDERGDENDHNFKNNHFGNDNDDDDEEEEDLHDMNVDVQSNLDILSQLFPDMKHVKPALEKKQETDEENGSNAEGDDGNDITGQSASASSLTKTAAGMGFMQRYDPTKESSKKYEVEPAVKENDVVSDGNIDNEWKKDNEDDEVDESAEEKKENNDSADEESASTSEEEEDNESSSSSVDSKDEDSDAKEKIDNDEELPQVEIKKDNKKNDSTTPTEMTDGEETQKQEEQQQKKKSTQLYEQKKLEGIFRDAREGSGNTEGGGGGMTFGFQFDDSTNDKDSKEEKKTEDSGVLYEQKKLENIFRQAREGGAGHDGGGGDAGGGGMSFGFQFDVTENDNAKKPSGGDISAIKAGKEEEVIMNVSTSTGVEGLEKKDTESSAEDHKTNEFNRVTDGPEALFEIKRRDGMRLPEALLDELENVFFSLNDGDKILRDVEAMRNDENEQKAWHEERRVLTADWKRKHKYACSQKQKKMKYR